MPHDLQFTADPSALLGAGALQLIGRRDRLESPTTLAHVPEGARAVWSRMLKGDPGDAGRSATTWLDGDLQRVSALVLPEACSRHNAPSRVWAYPRLLPVGRATDTALVVALDHADHAFAAAVAIARSLPSFSARSAQQEGRTRVLLLGPEGPLDPGSLPVVAHAVQQAAEWVDLPPDRLGPDAFVAAARRVAATRGCGILVLRRRELAEQGMGGLLAVGRAAAEEPALVVLDHPGAGPGTCWVGKGITYDTGGLSIKTKTGMPGMKTDMGGAAAVLAAFDAAVALGTPRRLTAVLCIAENAIGPNATRPDDVLTLYSGKTVEVNNTDAEGRLVLADGVAWSVKHRKPAQLVDLATLTGAQAVATGKLHAAIVCDDEALEARAIRAGRACGDLVHPLPYAPELFRREFSSPIADMKNSVKDRSNAQSSCAAQFVADHLGAHDGGWLHVDLAAPAHSGGRGTGFGVGLLLTLLGCGAPVDGVDA